MTVVIIFYIVTVLVLIAIWRFLFNWRAKDIENYYVEKPMFIAHRGTPVLAPENTLTAYRSAVENGLKGIELDVISTADGKLVCTHNFDLERESDGLGFIDEISSDYIESVNTGIYTHPDNTVKMPFLTEAVKIIPKDIVINIEIKTNKIFDLKTVLVLIKMVRNNEIPHKLIVSSFNPITLCIFKLMCPSVPTGFLLDEENIHLFWCINLIHPNYFHPAAEIITPRLVEYSRKKNMKINTWTVNTKSAAEWLKELGVNGIITNYPNVSKKATNNSI